MKVCQLCILLWGMILSTVTMSHSNSIILETTNNKPALLIPIYIKNKEYNFIIDTGFSKSVLNTKSFPSLFKGNSTNRITTIDGEKNINTINNIDVRIGNKKILIENPSFLDLDKLSKVIGENIDGIIGMDVQKHLTLSINNKKIRIYEDYLPEDNMECISYPKNDYDLIEIPLIVSNKEFLFGLDTGSNTSFIFNKNLDPITKSDIVYSSQIHRTMSINGSKSHPEVIIKNMKIGSFNLRKNSFNLINKNINLLGLNFLSNFNTYIIDPKRNIFCFK